MQQTQHRYVTREKSGFLLLICFVTYASTYIGRNSFNAVLAQMVSSNAVSSSQSLLGLISTGFFVCYGAGQLLSGLAGDHLSPKWMVFLGVAGSALCNLTMALLHSAEAMLAVWCVNGFFQSMTWSPIVRIVSERMRPEPCRRACMRLAYTYPAGVLVTYGITALLVGRFDWQGTFVFAGALMAVAAALWLSGMQYVQRFFTDADAQPLPQKTETTAQPARNGKLTPFIPLIILVSGALVVQGALRDGVMTWVPTCLNSTFQLGVAFSTGCTMVLPVVNLLGVQAANMMLRRFGRNEIQSSMILFGAAAAGAFVIMMIPDTSVIITVLCFATLTACMTGINTMLVSLIPTYFVKWGRVSFVSGLLNAMTYVGSSIATYGMGALADHLGWSALFTILFSLALLGVAVLGFTLPVWKRSRKLMDAQ